MFYYSSYELHVKRNYYVDVHTSTANFTMESLVRSSEHLDSTF